MKLLEHAMEIVEKVLEKRIGCLVNMNKMQFGFTPGRGTIDALFILRRMQVKRNIKIKEKSCIYFVDLEKAFD